MGKKKLTSEKAKESPKKKENPVEIVHTKIKKGYSRYEDSELAKGLMKKNPNLLIPK